MTIAILIYLAGCIVSYLLSRRSDKKDFNDYTVCDRSYNLVMAIFSWVTVFATFIWDSLGNDSCDKPAKW